ncbi:hypothetical protein MtrunA17_Chr5g0418891 [Medicago truncatula]|uniref:Transmembrane protein, putative n=1 Tax=Medicago truncatula TaxID=3880 RepID=G7JWS1_MEDTR|nr:transmembrane protein, putative [Medicago truncatula]RHN55533.1 hypothetical protein MtrunA17_Chr5g0418891 [Medicago truncatula]
MKMLVLIFLMIFTLSLTAARRDPPPPLAFTHFLAVTRSDLPSPLFPDGVTNNTPLPPSLLPLPPPPSWPSNIEVHFHLNITLKIAFPVGIATILSIIGWISYKYYCNNKPTMKGSRRVEVEVEI